MFLYVHVSHYHVLLDSPGNQTSAGSRTVGHPLDSRSFVISSYLLKIVNNMQVQEELLVSPLVRVGLVGSISPIARP